MGRALSAMGLMVAAAVLLGCGKGKSPDEVKAASTATIVSNKLEAIAATGEPVTLEQFDQWYAEPPPGQNAADIYARAFAVLTSDDPKSAAFVSKNQAAIALLLQAAERTSCRYPIDLKKGFATPLPHLAKIKNCATLLSEAAVTDAGRGRTDAATKDILAGIRLSRSLENEPLLISRLVAVASVDITVQGLEQALTRKSFTEDQLLSIQQALHASEGVASFRRAIAGERVGAIAGFQVAPADSAESGSAAERGQANLEAYKKTSLYQDDFNFALDYLSALLARSDMPFPEALEAGESPRFESATGQKLILSAMFLPALGNSLTKAADVAAHLHIAQAALAVERFRLKHANALPDSLSELSPTFIEAVPTDPFDGKPVRYQKLPAKGYVIYSVGKDRKDDGGQPRADAKPGPSPDITFTVAR